MKTIPNLAMTIIDIIGQYTIQETEDERVIEIEEIPSILRMIASDYSGLIEKESEPTLVD